MATRSVALQEAGFGRLHACPEVLGSIYDAHFPYVLRICRRFFRRPEDAEDAAAEVFLKLHTVLDQKDEAHPFRPWLCCVAWRHCIDKLRRGKRERSSAVEGIDLGTFADVSSPSPLSQVLRKEDRKRLREQISRLPDYYRIPLLLRYYKRMSYSEIAVRLNRRMPAVRTILFRAKERLRRNMVS